VVRCLNFAEQRGESYNGIVFDVKTKGSSSLKLACVMDEAEDVLSCASFPAEHRQKI
jgi:hypothetical protein